MLYFIINLKVTRATLGEALAANWANIATLAVGLMVCFAASYMMFLRSEVRPGD